VISLAFGFLQTRPPSALHGPLHDWLKLKVADLVNAGRMLTHL
jgi:hypothetical protein